MDVVFINETATMSAAWLLLTVFAIFFTDASAKMASLHPVLVARSSLDWMPSRVNSLYSDVGAWSGKFRPVMDEIESDEALRFYQFLNYLDGSSFGTGPIDEFVDAMGRLANYMKQQNSRETQARGMRELEAINGEKGNSIKTVLEVSTLIMRKKRKFFCTGEVKEPIVNNKIICKDRILLPIAGASCRDAIMYWHPDLTEEHYCVGALEAKSAVHIMDIEGNYFRTRSSVDAGVPQGGILSPLLFSIFINFITHCPRCSYHLYADDLQLYTAARVKSLSDAIEDVNRDFDAIHDWSDRFGVSVNPSKCQAIVIGSSRMMSRVAVNSLPPIIFNGTVIPISPSVKDLGLYLDSTLGWQSQVSNVSQRVNGTLRCLYRLRNFLPAKTKTMLVQTLIFPIIDYGDVCYFDLNAVLLDKLDRLLNNCIRFVFNLRKYDHISRYRSELKWMPIRQRRSLRALTTLFSLLNSPTPPSYLISHFQFLCSSHAWNMRSSNSLLLLCPCHTSDFVHSSFHIQSIHLWNALPLDFRTITNQYAFKRIELRNYFLHK